MIEYSVLNCLLKNNELVSAIEVESKHFPTTKTQLMFEAVVLSIQKVGRCDADLLISFCKDEYGAHHWEPDFEKLIDATGAAANFSAYQQSLKTQYLKRTASQIGRTLYEDADITAAIDGLKQLDIGGGESGFDPSALSRMFIHALDNPPEFIPTGIPAIDSKLGGLHGSDLVVVGARPSMGKTALAINIALLSKLPFCFFSGEQGAVQLMQRMISIDGSVPLWKMRNRSLSEDDYRDVVNTSSGLSQRNFYVVDKPAPSLQDVVMESRRQHHKRGIKLILVDYLQRMKMDGNSRREAVGETVRGLKELARELDVPVVVLAQVNRSVDQREYKHPMMADLLESGEIESEADQILMLSRQSVYTKDNDDSSAILTVDKNRHGPTGKIDLHFEKSILQFRGDKAA